MHAPARKRGETDAPKSFAHYEGQDITVELAGRKTVKAGDEFVFHANSWIFGDSVAVRSVTQERVTKRHETVLKRGGDPAEHFKTRVLVDRTGRGVDQPYVQVATAASGPKKGKDRVYVGDNDFNATPETATIDPSLDAGKKNPFFASVRIESRSTAGQDGPPIRPAIHPDGTVYA